MDFKSFIFNNDFDSDSDSESKDNNFLVKFCISSENLNTVLIFSDFTVITKDQWRELVDAIENNTYYCLNFCKSNGGVFIITNGDTTEFKVLKYGCGGDGEISVNVKNHICLNEFKKIYNKFK